MRFFTVLHESNVPKLPTLPKVLPATRDGDIEALSSLLVRIGEIISLPVTSIYNDLLIEFSLESGYKARSSTVSGVDGYGSVSKLFLSALKAYDGDLALLENCTLSKWAAFLDPRAHGLLSNDLKWCPTCWKEDIENSISPYARLYWSLKDVQYCGVHHNRLSVKCAVCGSPQKVVPHIPLLTYCKSCGANLIETTVEISIETDEKNRSSWISSALRQLVRATNVDNQELSITDLSKSVKAISDEYFYGDIRRVALNFGVRSEGLVKWVSQTSKPTIYSLIDLCYRLEIPPVDLLSKDYCFSFLDKSAHGCQPTKFINKPQHMSSARKIELLFRLNQEIKKTDSWVGPKELATELGITFSTLQRVHPQQYKVLKSKHDKKRKKQVQIDQKDRIIRLEKSVKSLVNQRIPVSERHLRSLTEVKPSDLRRSEIKAHLIEILKELNED